MGLLSDFFGKHHDKKITFLGIGISHIELIKQAAKEGGTVTARDLRTAEKLGDTATELASLGVELILGENYLNNLCEDIIFRTPGMSFYKEELVKAAQRGAMITSETELFFKLCPCKIIGITGSDGKTTTTNVVAEFLKASGYNVHMGGNLGKPLLPEIDSINKDDFAVLELSSFQLISFKTSPHIGVITNISPNHLDIHKDMEEYTKAKENIISYQTPTDISVLNEDNPPTYALAGATKAMLCGFSIKKEVQNGAFLSQEGMLCLAKDGSITPVLHKDEVKLLGMHNIENLLAAMAATKGLVAAEKMAEVAKNFGGVEHRIEFVREHLGVRWYNDSIATSPTRTIAGLKSFNTPLVIIAGGYDKNIPFGPLVPHLIQRVKLLILMGKTADKIASALKEDESYGGDNPKLLYAKDMAEAVKLAAENTCEGDIVSLSPACASFDTYPNFAERGRDYKAIVNGL